MIYNVSRIIHVYTVGPIRFVTASYELLQFFAETVGSNVKPRCRIDSCKNIWF